MFDTIIRGVPARVFFRHEHLKDWEHDLHTVNDELTDYMAIPYRGLWNRSTTCTILIGDENSGEGLVGVTYCSVKDQFSYAKGRKLALKRALEVSDLSRDERKLVWDDYFVANRGYN